MGQAQFIKRLDGGFAFDVGEGGQRLSTGERQLVSLARALLADPEIFIMDEATSSVDTETERALWSSLGFSSIPLVMVFREQVMIYAQPGALPPPALEQLLTQVKDLDMEEVRAKLDEQDN